MTSLSCADILAGARPPTGPSPSGAGCARAATRRPAFPSSTSPTAPASIRSRWSRRTRSPTTQTRCCTSPPAARSRRPARSCRRRRRASRSRCRPIAVEVVGWVDDPDTYPIQPKPHTLEFLREVAHLRPRTNVIGAVTRVRHTIAQAIHRFFHERRLLLGQHADHHGVRRRGRGRAVPRLDARPREPAARRRGQGRLRAGLLRARDVPHRVRASSTSRPTAWRCRRSTPSARRSAPRTRTPAGTWPSSG